MQGLRAAIVIAAFVMATGAQARVVHHAHHHPVHARVASTKPTHRSTLNVGVMNAGALSQTTLPIDGVATVNGIEMGCTGIGLDARENTRWADFPVRVEFSGAYHQYVPSNTLVVKDGARMPLVYVRCDAPWVLLRLEPGEYRVAGAVEGFPHPQSWRMKLAAHRTKTRRIVFHFAEVTGSSP